MAELVYPPVLLTAHTMFRALAMRISVEGAEHVPAQGGAVLASNHVSYLDFIFVGLGARKARRLVRFMAKQQVFAHRISGPLMRGMHHIPVDREAGKAAYDHAVRALRDGEVVGVFPEATISRSFTVKGCKSGAARMAAEAAVPLLPMAVWGGQRLWTKGRPRALGTRHVPIAIRIGEPLHLEPGDDPDKVTAELRARMQKLLDGVQADYPEKPAEEAWWLPAHLGGTAPTPEEAAVLDARKGR